MNHAGLLQDCRDYFEKAQSSWDAYFSKWEAMAEEEEDVGDEDDFLKEEKTATVRRRTNSAKQLRKKSIAVLNRKRPELNVGRKSKWKRERVQGGKSRDRKRETEIIHTTENQTNLECEVVNNKHFEADLKAIFIEILSENTNKMGIFSVLSRTFSGTGGTISNFSLSSMVMEKHGFSISPVSKTVLHSATRNEFPLGGIPRGGITDASARSCVNVTHRHTSSHASNAFNDIRMGHLLNDNPNQSITAMYTPDVRGDWISGKHLPISTNSREGCNDPTEESSVCVSPEATLRKILDTPGNVRKKCMSEKGKKRKRVRSVLVSSDDDSEGETKPTPEKFLKIFCTPRRPRRTVESEAAEDSDDDDFFRIIDRVKKADD